MKSSRRLQLAAASLTISASALAMGVGTASAATTDTSASTDLICTGECGPLPLPVIKLLAADAGHAHVSEITIMKVLDKTSPVIFR